MAQAQTTVSAWMSAPVSLDTPDEFVIGDVHGCTGLLESLLGAMAEEAPDGSRLTLLGDLIDRGPDSLGCLRLAARPARELGFAERHVLYGNHETMMMRAMSLEGHRQSDAFRLWILNGGWAAMDSFGVQEEYDARGRLRIADAILESLGGAASLLEDLKTHRQPGNLLLVHAGIRPDVPLSRWFDGNPLRPVECEDMHFAWIRFPFLRWESGFENGMIVVHGHTPEDTVQHWKSRHDAELHRLDGWRLGLDGGSYRTGRVAGAQFRQGEYRVFVASAQASGLD
jgi:serine/threonine protein phosphatase 1